MARLITSRRRMRIIQPPPRDIFHITDHVRSILSSPSHVGWTQRARSLIMTGKMKEKVDAQRMVEMLRRWIGGKILPRDWAVRECSILGQPWCLLRALGLAGPSHVPGQGPSAPSSTELPLRGACPSPETLSMSKWLNCVKYLLMRWNEKFNVSERSGEGEKEVITPHTIQPPKARPFRTK